MQAGVKSCTSFLASLPTITGSYSGFDRRELDLLAGLCLSISCTGTMVGARNRKKPVGKTQSRAGRNSVTICHSFQRGEIQLVADIQCHQVPRREIKYLFLHARILRVLLQCGPWLPGGSGPRVQRWHLDKRRLCQSSTV